MLTVHHLEKSRSQRVLWLLEELNVPYQIKTYLRDKKTMLALPELKSVHPLGKSPVITDGDLTIAESGAILEYLVDAYGSRAPTELGVLKPMAGTPAHRQYVYWMHYAEGSLMPSLVMKLIFTDPAHAIFCAPDCAPIVRQSSVQLYRSGHRRTSKIY